MARAFTEQEQSGAPPAGPPASLTGLEPSPARRKGRVRDHANSRSIDTTIRGHDQPDNGPLGTLANPYGRINGFGDPREIQVGLKLKF